MASTIKTQTALKQQQKLAMTPMMQQALKILQLSTVELVEYLEQEMTENPMLEMEEIREEASQEAEKADRTADEEAASATPDAEGFKETQSEAEARETNLEDWKEYFESNGSQGEYAPRESAEGKFLESAVTILPTLQDHLLWQLRLSCDSEEDLKTGEEIVGNIDEQGYLRITLEELSAKLKAPPAAVQRMLELVQTFEPVGVGARDLRETLLLQLKYHGKENSWAYKIADQFLRELERRRFAVIGRSLGISLAAVKEAAQLIGTLEPKPGLQFGSEEPKYVVPDILLEKVDDEYVIILNEGGLPRLKLSREYRDLLVRKKPLDPAAREFLQQKLQSAIWLIRSLEQRRRTIFKVAETIVEIQRGFFEHGIAHLRPLTLKKIAQKIQMHESTVSRVTTHKYMQTPRGVLELKFFFTSGIERDEAEASSSLSVKAVIQDLIENEPDEKPLSDQHLTRVLSENGYRISRRTVTKYREVLKILPVHQRRKI